MNEANPLPPPPPGAIETNPDARLFGMLCHLLALTGYVSIVGFVVGPLVIWLMKKDEFPFVDNQGKEALNFQILMLVLTIACVPLACLGVVAAVLIALPTVNLIFIIIATVKSNKGEWYRYPFNWRLIR